MENADTPGGRLKLARLRAGYASAAEFAKKMRLAPVTYRAYEADQNGYAEKAPEFAAKLGVSTDWLLRGGDKPENGDLRPPARVLSDAIDGTVYIRQVDISYAMGDGALVEDYPETGLIPFDLNFLRTLTSTITDHLFIARGDGDSMHPTLMDGDIVLVDTSQRRVAQQDRIWAASVAGAGMIKRIRRLPGDRFEILSDNKMVPPQVVEADDLHVIGRVIWVGRRI